MSGRFRHPRRQLASSSSRSNCSRPTGRRPPKTRYRRDLPPETLAWLYESMVVTRELDTEFVNLQRQGELALFASCRGQEAAQVGAAACLRKTDWLFPQYRETRRLPGARHRARPDRRGVARQLARRAGLHHEVLRPDLDPDRHPRPARRRRGDGRPAPRRGLGDRGVPRRRRHVEGDVHEALNLAAVFGAPCVFFVQNNQWAISVPVERQHAGPSIAHRAVGYGMPGIRVDGNDVLACYAVMAEAAARARSGGGPTLIEAVTYRMGPHTTSDDPTRYRSEDEVEPWRAATRSPATARTSTVGVWTERLEERVARRSARLRTELREAVVTTPDIDVTEVFDTVYLDITPDLARQRDQLAAELAKEA